MKPYRIIVLLLILLAFFLRVWSLPTVPPGLWYDEAYNALDAIWAAKTGAYPLFFVGNNGREPMWHYLLLASISMVGNIPFAVHWVGALVGLLTVPVMYRFAYALLQPFARRKRDRCWLALVATGWLAVSWWHILNSVSGLRPILLPPLLMSSLYFWLSGVRKQAAGNQSLRPFALAGLFLGLSQYSYLPARMAPLIIVGFVIVGTAQLLLVNWQKAKSADSLRPATLTTPVRIGRLWLGFLVTGLVACLVFAPLGLFFLENPDAFSSRTGDVFFSPDNLGELVAHVLQAVSLFFGAGHELYRHHLPGRAMLGYWEIPFFLIGLITLLRPIYLRRPETQLTLLGFGIMWLPALLASPPVHSLRPIGLLPFYYLLVTVGLYQLARALYYVLRNTRYATRNPRDALRLAFTILPGVIITLNLLVNIYDYQRWTRHPEVYKEYNGPLVDLTYHLLDLTRTHDVIIPFHLYVHPTTRFLLGQDFSEVTGALPPLHRPVEMLLIPDNFQLLYVGNIPASPAMVLLTRDEAGRGAVYVSRPPRNAEQEIIDQGLAARQSQLQPFTDRLGRTIGLFVTLPAQAERAGGGGLSASELRPLFDPTPLRTVNLNWADQVQLTGYDLTPQLAGPGQEITLNLYWHSLTNKSFAQRMFLQLIDGAGNPVNQWEVDAFQEDMYRWRADGLLPTRHTLWLGPEIPTGPYLVRLGFFDEFTGERLPLQVNDDGGAPLDQVQLGLFYVSSDARDPRQPATPLSANFADFIQLIGVSLPGQLSSPLAVTIHWQAIQPTDRPYTVFLQLLNEQGEVVSGWDQQPFAGLYPSNLWSPGEIIVDTIQLPLPEAGLPPGTYRLISGWYDFESGQRLTVVGDGDFAELAEFTVE